MLMMLMMMMMMVVVSWRGDKKWQKVVGRQNLKYTGCPTQPPANSPQTTSQNWSAALHQHRTHLHPAINMLRLPQCCPKKNNTHTFMPQDTLNRWLMLLMPIAQSRAPVIQEIVLFSVSAACRLSSSCLITVTYGRALSLILRHKYNWW